MHKPVCVACKREMKLAVAGVRFVDKYTVGEIKEVLPYRIWHADKFACPVCGVTILSGFGESGITNWEPDFNDALKNALLDEETVVENI